VIISPCVIGDKWNATLRGSIANIIAIIPNDAIMLIIRVRLLKNGIPKTDLVRDLQLNPLKNRAASRVIKKTVEASLSIASGVAPAICPYSIE
jgi:hypothetical protein